jgi:hypothetical protein
MIIFNLYVSRSSSKTATTCGLICKWNPELFIFKCIKLLGLLLVYITASVEGFVELEMGARILSFTVG